MNDSLPTRSGKKRRLLWIGLLTALILAPVGVIFFRDWRISREKECALQDLRNVLEQVDRDERQGWDYESLERSRDSVAPDENGADVARQAWESLPPDWDTLAQLPVIGIVSPNPSVRLRHEDAAQVEQGLARYAAAIAEARKLTEFTTGRFPAPVIEPDHFLHAPKDNLKKLSILADLLAYEAVLDAHKKRITSAGMAALAIVHVGRIMGDDYGLHSQGLRLTCPGKAASVLQRVLGQGEVDDSHLSRASRVFDEEDAYPAEERLLRSERAWLHHFYTNLAAGRVDPKEKLETFEWGPFEHPDVRTAMIHRSHAYALRYLNDAIHCTQQGRLDCVRCVQDLDERHKAGLVAEDVPALARVLTPGVFRIVRPDRWSELSCVRAALATERYRLKSGRWPEKLDDVVQAGFSLKFRSTTKPSSLFNIATHRTAS